MEVQLRVQKPTKEVFDLKANSHIDGDMEQENFTLIGLSKKQ
jgi:hypothetical protein